MIGKAVFPGGNAQSLDNIAGQPIAEYTHAKSGTVHKLEGPENAKNIVFKATGDYNDGDTWTLNNKPVTVTYNGGEELLPTAVLIGDMVEAVIMGDQVRLMLQKPVPQDSLTENWYLINPINQHGKTEYTTNGYTIDRWKLDGAGMVSIDNNKIILAASSEKTLYFTQFLSLSDEMLDKTITFTILLANGSIYYATGTIRQGIYIKNIISGWISCYMVNAKPGIVFSVGKSLELEPVAVKLEPGDRFTGWPAWDYGTELVKCQKYFRVAKQWDFWKGIDVQPNYIDFPFPGLYGMRTKPAIINPEGFNLSKQGFTFELVSFGISPRLRAAKTNHGVTGALLQANSNIYFDANL